MDQKVLMTQVWLNNTYSRRSGYIHCDEDGATGNGTVASLISALQLEIGISSPTGEFGPATAAACPTLNSSSTGNIVKILQGALWCKGFSSADLTGKFDIDTISGVNMFEMAAGFSGNSTVTPKIFKGLLSTDAVVLISGGDSRIRQIQQALNRSYSDYFWKDLNICPCDGVYGRNTCNALLYAFQAAVGIDEPNGVFGPGTAAQAGEHNVALGSGQTELVYLLQYLLYVNGYNPGSFDGGFGSGVESAVMQFQNAYALDADGYVGLSTWAALLVSKGNVNRSPNAIDCTDTITQTWATKLKSMGINYVGRYLTGYWPISFSELKAILDAGLNYIPIFERSGNDLSPGMDVTDASYFNYYQGKQDGEYAVSTADRFGLPRGTVIYFAVDFDAYDYEVSDNILPYFNGVKNAVNASSDYRVGIYGPRNVCTRVANAGYSEKSYVADMSTGFSGNIGQRIPSNWAFDQYYETTFTNGSERLGVDKVMASGRDGGVSSISTIDTARNLSNRILMQYGVSLNANFEFNQTYTIDTSAYKIDYKVALSSEFSPIANPAQTVTMNVNNGHYEETSLSSASLIYDSLSSEVQTTFGKADLFNASYSLASTINNGTVTTGIAISNEGMQFDAKVEQAFYNANGISQTLITEMVFTIKRNSNTQESIEAIRVQIPNFASQAKGILGASAFESISSVTVTAIGILALVWGIVSYI